MKNIVTTYPLTGQLTKAEQQETHITNDSQSCQGCQRSQHGRQSPVHDLKVHRARKAPFNTVIIIHETEPDLRDVLLQREAEKDR